MKSKTNRPVGQTQTALRHDYGLDSGASGVLCKCGHPKKYHITRTKIVKGKPVFYQVCRGEAGLTIDCLCKKFEPAEETSGVLCKNCGKTKEEHLSGWGRVNCYCNFDKKPYPKFEPAEETSGVDVEAIYDRGWNIGFDAGVEAQRKQDIEEFKKLKFGKPTNELTLSTLAFNQLVDYQLKQMEKDDGN